MTRLRSRTRRRGSISVIVLIAVPVLLLALALAVFASQRVQARTEMQNCADAAALAAGLELVDDVRLLNDEQLTHALIDNARKKAQELGLANPVLGEPQKLDANEKNRPDGDIVAGFRARPRGVPFEPLAFEQSGDALRVNAVRVVARRTEKNGNPLRLVRGPFLSRLSTDMIVLATAVLDQQVLGFRPVTDKPLPLVPIALLSARPGSGGGRSWEEQVGSRLGGKVLPEMEVRFGLEKGNAAVLHIGADGPEGLADQMKRGITRRELEAVGGELVLNRDRQLPLEGSLGGPTPGQSYHYAMYEAFELLRLSGEKRIWPLFSGVDAGSGNVVVTGFVAARVVRVEEDAMTGELVVTLRPAMLASAAAVTVTDRPELKLEVADNPYLCKVRLVQ